MYLQDRVRGGYRYFRGKGGFDYVKDRVRGVYFRGKRQFEYLQDRLRYGYIFQRD